MWLLIDCLLPQVMTYRHIDQLLLDYQMRQKCVRTAEMHHCVTLYGYNTPPHEGFQVIIGVQG